MTEAKSQPPPPPPQAPGATAPTIGAERRRGRRRRILAVVSSVVALVVIAAVAAGFVIRVDKVIISPGAATPLDSGVVQIDGAPTYPLVNPVRFLTVRVTNVKPNLWRYLRASLDPDDEVVDRGAVVGCRTPTEDIAYNALTMQQSQNDAINVALTRLGYAVTTEPPRVTVIETCPGAPAYGKLAVGDRVVSVDGQPVGDGTQLGNAVRAHQPGDTIGFAVERQGESRDVTVDAGELVTTAATGSGSNATARCVPARAGHTARGPACIGALSQTFVKYHFPIAVNIDIERVGGPSAGLAFALAIIDNLTPGALTDHTRVAVTGAIASDGSVQPVGGVEQKAITARRNGMQLMLVPKVEVAEARKGAEGMKVVGVETIDDALAALQRAGGAAVPPASTVAARS